MKEHRLSSLFDQSYAKVNNLRLAFSDSHSGLTCLDIGCL